MGQQALATGMQGVSTVGGMYSAYQQGKQAKYNIKQEAALKKTQLLEEYRETLASNLANSAASGFTQQGNVSQINEANAMTLDSDLSDINSQASSQIQLAKLGAKGQMASIFSSGLTSVVTDYANKKDAWAKIGGDSEEFSYFNPKGKSDISQG